MSEEKVTAISQVLTAWQDQRDEIFYVNTPAGQVNLAQVLGMVRACRGFFQPLGMCEQERFGATTLVTSIYVFVLADSEAGKIISGINSENNSSGQDSVDSGSP